MANADAIRTDNKIRNLSLVSRHAKPLPRPSINIFIEFSAYLECRYWDLHLRDLLLLS